MPAGSCNCGCCRAGFIAGTPWCSNRRCCRLRRRAARRDEDEEEVASPLRNPLVAAAGGARRAPRVSFGGVEDDRDMSWLFGDSDDSDDSGDSDDFSELEARMEELAEEGGWYRGGVSHPGGWDDESDSSDDDSADDYWHSADDYFGDDY